MVKKYVKNFITLTMCFALVLGNIVSVYARVGDMGFFGGISQGRRLPKTTEELLAIASTQNSLVYKEEIFIGGTPHLFQGLLNVTYDTKVDYVKNPTGSFKETYQVVPSALTNAAVTMTRKIVFNVNYRTKNNQLILDYGVSSWTESITIPEGTYVLDPTASNFGLSIIEDKTPGVTYYKGDISQKSVYTGGPTDTTLDVSGSFYGYNSPYSTTETHRLNGTVTTPDWQMEYQVRPNVTVDKTLVYGKNEPQLISFDGNYKEVIQNQSGFEYTIFVKPPKLFDLPTEGQADISAYSTFEQLIAPNMDYLKGNFAETDVKKLFAMSILDGDTKFYVPNQAITRGQYITMLAKAIKLDTTKYNPPTKKTKTAVISIVFPDVKNDRPDYKYIMSAFDVGLAIGRDNGHYYPDSPITREEALVILLRCIGLGNLGLDPTPVTTFVDDNKISEWAKKEIYAAQRIGLISGDSSGRINPSLFVSKAEAAALTNRLIDYMRKDMEKDYGQNIVHFAN